jgi:outer membrane receptor protein involved in Fe transport
LGGPSRRIGSASSLRARGDFFDLAGNVTWVRATFADTGLLIPYVPDLIVRADGSFFADVPWGRERLGGHAVRASASYGITYVGPRPLPYGTRSDRIFTVDGNVTLGWRALSLSASVQNLFDVRYRMAEFNYASDFRTQATSAMAVPSPTLVPVRHFTAGAPRTFLLSIGLTWGGAS